MHARIDYVAVYQCVNLGLKVGLACLPIPLWRIGVGLTFQGLTTQATQPLHESHEMPIGLELMGLWAAFEVAFI